MEYKTFPCHSELSAVIKCYWTLEGPGDSRLEKQRIVPDGCMEMIFHLGDPYRQYLNPEETILQPKSFVFGQITSSLEIEPTGRTRIFAVRFQPDGFIPYASIPLRKMDNKAVSLSELFGPAGRSIEKEIRYAPDTSARIDIIEAFLLKRLVEAKSIDRVVKSAVDIIMSIEGRISVNDLSGHLNITRRQMERKFAASVGLSPKQLSKIIRLQSALKLIQRKTSSTFTVIAHKSEYYDQAHFVKDFKEFTGSSPKQFFSGNLLMSSLFYGTE